MASPAYVWLVDDNGEAIQGSSKVKGREGSMEVYAFEYGVHMPVDKFSGSNSGTRQHESARMIKSFDKVSPLLFQAACDGKTFKTLTIKWYRINEQGKEEEYFSHLLEGVKVVSYEQRLFHTKEEAYHLRTHEDVTAFRFKKITIKSHDGNIAGIDSWLERS